VRGSRVIAVLVAALLIAASVSFTSRYTLEIVDSEGRPQIAYAIYAHRGSRPNFVHPVSYEATPRTLVRGEADGRLTFPAAVHLHRPFPLETHPSLWIEMVYVPRLHNASGRIGGGYAASTAGVWETDLQRRRALVFDLSDRPERWQGTLSNLVFVIRELVAAPPRDRDPEAADLLLELISHFRAEYDAFLARWGDVPRTRPPMPAFLSETQQREWAETIDADLARHPTWGTEIRRSHEREMTWLREAEAAMR
jgi:hypothetical protein